MDRQKKDELIALLRDAASGLKWSVIIIAIMISISYFWEATAQPRITTSAGIFGSEVTTSVTVQEDVSEIFAFAIQAHSWPSHSNVALELKTDMTRIVTGKKCKYQIDANTGMGWGHYNYEGPTDHNYHTYDIGIDIYRHFERFSVVLSPMVVCRTWQGHIGLHQPTFMATLGISTTL